MAEGKKLVIRKKGEDGTKTFSVRLKEETIRRIDELAMKTDRSRNELIGMLLEFGLDNCETEQNKDTKSDIAYRGLPRQVFLRMRVVLTQPFGCFGIPYGHYQKLF